MAGKVEFDRDRFLLYKDQSTCTGGPEVFRQPTPSANSGECDDVPGNWKETIQSKHWVYLLGNLSVDKIVDHLYQGVDGKSLVTEEVHDEIENAKSKKEANKIFLKHLLNAGTEESLKLFCTVLRQTSNDYQIHEEILEKLKADFKFGM